MNEHNEIANIVADAMEVFIENNFNKPMTNYDRIKSMSVEEMAKIICKSENCEKICVFSKDGKCNAFGTDASICVEGCKQWLLQEVSENDR